ncbi:MAG: superoxide dismutase [Mariniphaga sp.]|nr:superoxide dismutase [Mariniphaga sp.]
MERRKFITAMGTLAAATPFIGSLASCAAAPEKFEGHKFPDLGYDFNALEPHIDALTMEVHYTKHQQGYFNNFMKAIDGTVLLETPVEQIFTGISKHPESVRNNGGGFYNHALFWENMTPTGIDIPAAFKTAIEKDFGSVDSMKEKFSQAAKTLFGSGWAWLSVNSNGKLFVSTTPNQDNPLMDIVGERGIPLLSLDVWEHAYYLKYQNRRAEYVDNFWNLVNWKVVNSRLEKAIA